MPYYVPLGVRGLILRVGAAMTVVVGTVVYWRGARRRAGAAKARHRDRPKLAA